MIKETSPTPIDVPVTQPTAEILLDFIAQQNCDGHTGRRWSALSDDERQRWRKDAVITVQEWHNEYLWEVSRHPVGQTPKRKDDDPSPGM